MKQLILSILLLSAAHGLHGQSTSRAEVYLTDSGHAEFHSSVPLHEFTGTSGHLTGMIDLNENLVDFYLDLRSLKTGNNRRDRDMYRTLNVEKHPYAEFTGTITTPFDPSLEGLQEVSVNGTFTIHGIGREKRVRGTLERVGDRLILNTEWTQSLSEHEIEPPGLLFYRVRDQVEIRIEAILQPGRLN